MNNSTYAEGSDVEVGTDNPYADLGLADADEMLAKAKLAQEIGQWISKLSLPEILATKLPIPHSELSDILLGKFRHITHARMLECLTRLRGGANILVSATT